MQRSGKNWIYVKQGDGVLRRNVKVGASNDKYVVVERGIDSGELIVLNPGSIREDAAQEEMDQVDPPVEGVENLVAKTGKASAIN